MAEIKDQAKDAIPEGTSKAKRAAEAVASKTADTLSQVRNWPEPVLKEASRRD